MFEQSFTPAVEQAEPVSDMVYAAAENDPEYDANDALPCRKNTIEVRMERKIRGLEDHETQERKRLFRDVRSPLQRMGDTLRLGHVQTGGIFAAGVCLFLFSLALHAVLYRRACSVCRPLRLCRRRKAAFPNAARSLRHG